MSPPVHPPACSQKPLPNASELRLALALLVLAKTPRGASSSLAILHLRTLFAQSAQRDEGIEMWKSRALELERELRSVQSVTESERAGACPVPSQLIALRVASAHDDASGPKGAKKGKKAEPAAKNAIPRPPAASLTPALHALHALTLEPSRAPPRVLVASFARAAQCVGERFRLMICAHTGSASLTKSVGLPPDAIMHLMTSFVPRSLAVILGAVVTAHAASGIPKKATADADSFAAWFLLEPGAADGDEGESGRGGLARLLDALFGSVIAELLLPALAAVTPHSHARATALLSSRLSAVYPRDAFAPAELLRPLGAVLAALDGAADEAQKKDCIRGRTVLNRTAAARMRVATTAVKEVRRVLEEMAAGERSAAAVAEDESAVKTACQQGKDQRSRFGRKDAVHVLCTAAAVWIAPAPADAGPSLVRDMLANELGLLASASTSVRDDVVRDMVLAVLEKAWECGVAFGEVWDEDEMDIDCDEAGT
ncbi:hypothetical protein K488DRAFT_91472 [Vararia minispora EC-137]|uniref:Uncharacterized protein n=1 Tax=Vararia minispora EC-137 TaxID=1314806 RepID=A0ACB8Q616_9AGAM|nr:hypothetical protein K488DRAFT_91472 [Vararia minispora EC-137]